MYIRTGAVLSRVGYKRMRSRTAQSWTLENKFKPFIEEFQRIINGIQRTENSRKFQDFEDNRSEIQDREDGGYRDERTRGT